MERSLYAALNFGKFSVLAPETEHFIAFWLMAQLPLWAPGPLPWVYHQFQPLGYFCCLALQTLPPSGTWALCSYARGDPFKPGYQFSAEAVVLIIHNVLCCSIAMLPYLLKKTTNDHYKVISIQIPQQRTLIHSCQPDEIVKSCISLDWISADLIRVCQELGGIKRLCLLCAFSVFFRPCTCMSIYTNTHSPSYTTERKIAIQSSREWACLLRIGQRDDQIWIQPCSATDKLYLPQILPSSLKWE